MRWRHACKIRGTDELKLEAVRNQAEPKRALSSLRTAPAAPGERLALLNGDARTAPPRRELQSVRQGANSHVDKGVGDRRQRFARDALERVRPGNRTGA